MIVEILILLKTAKNEKEKNVYYNMLEKLGMDKFTANLLLKEV